MVIYAHTSSTRSFKMYKMFAYIILQASQSFFDISHKMLLSTDQRWYICVSFVISFSYCLPKHNVASRYYCKSIYFIPFGETAPL